MSNKPTDVGDLIQFIYTVIPPASNPSGISNDVHLFVEKPGGPSVEQAAPTQHGPASANQWLCTADARCDVAGRWTVRVNCNTPGMLDSLEFVVEIHATRFAVPLP